MPNFLLFGLFPIEVGADNTWAPRTGCFLTDQATGLLLRCALTAVVMVESILGVDIPVPVVPLDRAEA